MPTDRNLYEVHTKFQYFVPKNKEIEMTEFKSTDEVVKNIEAQILGLKRVLNGPPIRCEVRDRKGRRCQFTGTVVERDETGAHRGNFRVVRIRPDNKALRTLLGTPEGESEAVICAAHAAALHKRAGIKSAPFEGVLKMRIADLERELEMAKSVDLDDFVEAFVSTKKKEEKEEE